MKTILLSLMLGITPFLFSQVAPFPEMSYDAFLCEEELYKDQIICLNNRIDEENDDSDSPQTAFLHCNYSNILYPYSDFGLPTSFSVLGHSCDGVCCGSGDFTLLPISGGRYDNRLHFIQLI